MPRFTFSWEANGCRQCGGPLQLRPTRSREVVSARYGRFVAIERQGHCLNHPDLPPARSEKLQRIVAPGCNIAYDVITHIGLARFVECRQCEEIRIELSRHYGIDVPVRTISELTQKFVAYFQIVHRQSIQLLCCFGKRAKSWRAAWAGARRGGDEGADGRICPAGRTADCQRWNAQPDARGGLPIVSRAGEAQ